MTPRGPTSAEVAAAGVGDLVTSGEIQGWDIAFAIAALIAGWVLGRFVQRGARRVLHRVQGINEDLRQLAARVAKYLVWMMGVGVALGFLGAAVQPILATSLLVGAVAVLALRGVADNFAAGVVIQTRQPIQLGDEVEVLGHVGIVKNIDGRSVILETSDGTTVHVPNSKVLENPLTNNSAVAYRRSEIEVRTAWIDDIGHLLDVISGALRDLTEVLPEPAPTIRVTGTDPSRITFEVRVWHLASTSSRATSAGIVAIATALRAERIDATLVTPPPDLPLTPPPTL